MEAADGGDGTDEADGGGVGGDGGGAAVAAAVASCLCRLRQTDGGNCCRWLTFVMEVTGDVSEVTVVEPIWPLPLLHVWVGAGRRTEED